MLSIHVRKISPESAKSIIETHVNYRSLSARRVSAYAKLMNEGKWARSVLIFDEDGELIDGQSRLNAVIKSGVAQEFACIVGWDKNHTVYLDNGQPRSRSQVAKKERGVKNGNKVMSLVCSVENPIREQQPVILNSEAIELYDKYGAICEEVLSALHSSALAAAVHTIAFARCLILYPETKEKVFQALSNLKNLDFSAKEMNALKMYYKWAIERGFSKGGGAVRVEAYKRCARALVAFINGEYLDKLYCPSCDPLVTLMKRK